MRLQQVIVNLLHNAVQYADGPGRVQVHAHFSSTQVLISVEDKGPGIPG